MTDIVIGIDLGGTRIKVVAIDQSGNLLYEQNQPTNDGDDKVWKNAVKTAVNEIQNKLQIKDSVVGISAPGLPNSSNSAIAFMPGRMQVWRILNGRGFWERKLLC